MHIAQSSESKLISVEKLAKLAGVKRRQIANLARAGEIPGARSAPNGYHFEYPDTPELRSWIKQRRRVASERSQLRRLPAPVKWYSARADVDMQLPRKLAETFFGWYEWMKQNRPLHRWSEEDLRALKSRLAVFNTAYEAVAKQVKESAKSEFLESCRHRDGMPVFERHVKGKRPDLIRMDAISE
jgi:hypothetical protein